MTILNCFSRSNDRFGNAGLASNAGVMQRSIKLNSHILWRPFEADLDCVRDASANSSFPIIDVQVWYVPKWAFIDDVYVCWIGLLFCVIDSQRYDDYVRNANVTISFHFCDNTGEKWFAFDLHLAYEFIREHTVLDFVSHLHTLQRIVSVKIVRLETVTRFRYRFEHSFETAVGTVQ